MAGFSITEAAQAGFGLITRKPLAVALWGLVYGVLYGAPIAVMVSSLLQNPGLMAAQMPGAAPNPAMFAAFMRMELANLLAMTGSFCAHVLVFSAICRAHLEPADDAYGYLRLGARELWLGLAIIVSTVLIMVALFGSAAAVAIPLGIVAMIVRQAAFSALLVILGVVVVASVTTWVALRLSLAGPMTFAKGQFQVFESWALTKGQTKSLFLMSLLILLLVMLVETAVMIVLGVAAIVVAVSSASHWGASASDPVSVMRLMTPWIVTGALVLSVLAGALIAIFSAPFVSVYRSLTEPPPAAPWGTPAA